MIIQFSRFFMYIFRRLLLMKKGNTIFLVAILLVIFCVPLNSFAIDSNIDKTLKGATSSSSSASSSSSQSSSSSSSSSQSSSSSSSPSSSSSSHDDSRKPSSSSSKAASSKNDVESAKSTPVSSYTNNYVANVESLDESKDENDIDLPEVTSDDISAPHTLTSMTKEESNNNNILEIISCVLILIGIIIVLIILLKNRNVKRKSIGRKRYHSSKRRGKKRLISDSYYRNIKRK